ncbi:hypothetical protein BC943DRAFT_380257 [Umbelopsis sp. AD052]|nr:hypothetical protein BC943DRAFT_380257 [Umbelopsis sp. AD052]
MSPISSLPHKLLRHILGYLSNEELYSIMPVSTVWNATAGQLVAHSFRSQHLVMWIDQEGHRMCNPLWTFDSYNTLTNVIRFKPYQDDEFTTTHPDIYNLMFGLKRPCLRLITIGDDHHYDYLEKAGSISLKHTGQKTMLASDLSAADNTYHQWRFTYRIEYLYRKNRKIDGERVFIPEIFECSLSFLNPKRAHRTKLAWYVKKHMKNINPAPSKNSKRTKIHGEVSPSEWNSFFSQQPNDMMPQMYVH